MGWLRLVGSLKLQVSFAESSLFYVALLQKILVISRSLLIVANPYETPSQNLLLKYYPIDYHECSPQVVLTLAATLCHDIIWRQLQHYIKCNTISTATLYQLQHYIMELHTTCNTISSATLHQLQHYIMTKPDAKCNTISAATLYQLQHYINCHTIPTATLCHDNIWHQLQHYINCNSILTATLYQLQHYIM